MKFFFALFYVLLVAHGFWIGRAGLYFWYAVIAAIVVEAGIFAWKTKAKFATSLFISIALNLISVFWAYLWAGCWMLLIDEASKREVYFPAQVLSISIVWFWVFLSATGIKALVARMFWKYSIRTSFPIFLLGNILYYGVSGIAVFNAYK